MGLKLLDSPSDGAADIDGASDTDGRGDGNDRKMKDLMMITSNKESSGESLFRQKDQQSDFNKGEGLFSEKTYISLPETVSNHCSVILTHICCIAEVSQNEDCSVKLENESEMMRCATKIQGDTAVWSNESISS
eukprot:scaffold12299_cov85-Cyclotella_meneghiniana.AAC.4